MNDPNNPSGKKPNSGGRKLALKFDADGNGGLYDEETGELVTSDPDIVGTLLGYTGNDPKALEEFKRLHGWIDNDDGN